MPRERAYIPLEPWADNASTRHRGNHEGIRCCAGCPERRRFWFDRSTRSRDVASRLSARCRRSVCVNGPFVQFSLRCGSERSGDVSVGVFRAYAGFTRRLRRAGLVSNTSGSDPSPEERISIYRR
jgi:hypothetical protein